MGNRAVICYDKAKTSVAIYVHWNGGPESVLAFLEVCKRRGYRTPEADPSYSMARLCGLICEFFGGSDSVGIGQLKTLDVDNWDNGAYLIGPGWEIRARFGKGSAPTMNVHELGVDGLHVYNSIIEQLTEKE